MNKQINYEHIVYIEEKEGQPFLCIDRLFAGGRRDFCTHMPIRGSSSEEEGFGLLDEAADWLGHSICIDSPSFRAKTFGEDWPGENDDQYPPND